MPRCAVSITYITGIHWLFLHPRSFLADIFSYWIQQEHLHHQKMTRYGQEMKHVQQQLSMNMRHGNHPRCDRGQQRSFQNVINQNQMINAFHLSSLSWTWLEVSSQAPPHFRGLLACLRLPKQIELTDWKPLGPCSWTGLDVSSQAPCHFRGLLACLHVPKHCNLLIGNHLALAS